MTLKEYKKALYQVEIIRVPSGLCIYNFLDKSNCMTTEDMCFVVTGLQGEQWPIKKQQLKKYLTLDGQKLNPEGWKLGEKRTVKTDISGPHILVYFPTKTEFFPAPEAWCMTEPLVANPGDAVAYTMLADGSPDPSDKYVINASVFKRTYEEA